MASFTLRARARAPVPVVFGVLTDHRAYSRFTPVRSSELEREGDTVPDGTGAIRVLRLLGPPIREEVTAFEPPSRFAYRMLSGLPVRKHTGEVRLSESGDGTEIAYVVTTEPSLPVPDGMWGALVRPGIQRLLKGIVGESERIARG